MLTGKQLGDTTYKVLLDGYNQLDLLTGKGPSSRHEIFYFAEGTLGAVRIDDWKFRLIDQPDGWIGGTVKVDWPILSNLRLDPYERMQFAKGNTGLLRIRIGLLTSMSSGALSFCSRRSPNTPRPSSSFHRCRRARASISTQSRPRSKSG